ncbi:hypothetical protein NUU61_008964 [Penicillium alfredii]|uniref:Major facilitator superfamily (MFS) profile domain-containing protein n=1 Tax=Penicillium alfredii TaxID=1506179 RepID=A0A9W9EMC3_9EURO|nr:uncharacterized protein NUU61_008964 [Penicillium alfredii]KAJ5084385.1 hypothetical protein NUU61_008964 [Penicillium alfredii]
MIDQETETQRFYGQPDHSRDFEESDHESTGSDHSQRSDASIKKCTGDGTSNEPLLRAIQHNPKIVAYVIGLALTVLLSGYDNVIVGSITSAPQFQKDFGEWYAPTRKYIIPSKWLSLWSSMSTVGQIVGALFAGPWQDRAGRRWPLAMASVFSAVGVTIIYVSNLPEGLNARRSLFLVGEIIQGIALGVATTTAQTYISETVPTSLRGSAMALFPTFALTGQLVGAIVIFMSSEGNSHNSYLAAFGSMWPFSAIPFFMAILIPQSPAYLIQKQDPAGAYRSLRKLHTAAQDCGQLVQALQQSLAVKTGLKHTTPYRDCFRGTDRRRSLITAFAAGLPPLFGLSLLSSASYFLQVVGMESGKSMIMLVVGIAVGLSANGVGIWLASRAGRRILTMISLSITTALWLGMGIAGCWSGTVTVWYTSLTMMAIIVVCGMGVWPASYAIVGETSSLRLRAKTQSIGHLTVNGLTIVFSVVLPYIYNSDAGNLGAKTGFVYSALCLVSLAGTWWAVPEMKGRTAAEIDHMFELRLPAPKFRAWRSDVDVDDRIHMMAQ